MKIKIEGLTGVRLGVTSGYGKIDRQFISVLNPNNSDGDVSLYVTPPYSRGLSKKFNAIYTMHELDYLPPNKADWVNNLNEYDLVIVPSEWIKQNFIKFGVTKPIEVVPLGVDTSIFRGIKTPFFSIFTVHANFGGGGSRENWLETLECYCKAFIGHRDTVLWIKTWDHPEGKLDGILTEIAKKHKLNKNNIAPIEVITDEFSDKQMRELYLRSWLFIKNANREGWSLPLNEALATGNVCLYRKLPSLKWAEEYINAIPFSNAEMLLQLMTTFYTDYERDKNIKVKNDIKNIPLMIQKVVDKYYGKK